MIQLAIKHFESTKKILKQKYELHFPGAHHAILLVVVAKYRKTATVTEGSCFPQRVIINIFGHCH